MIGTVCGLKSTGERLFVLRTATEVEKKPFDLTGNAYVCRRPVVGQNGLIQQVEVFTEAEIESIEDNFTREFEEMILKAQVQKRVLSKHNEDEAAEDRSRSTDFSVN